MRVLFGMIALMLGLLGAGLNGSPAQPTDAPVVDFAFSKTGSSAYDNYRYTVSGEAETGRMEVRFELRSGNEAYVLPADDAFLRELSELIDSRGLWRWDGFDASRSGLSDGSGFSLRIGFGDGTEISASGYGCFPEGGSEATYEIDELFLGYLQANGITPEGGL